MEQAPGIRWRSTQFTWTHSSGPENIQFQVEIEPLLNICLYRVGVKAQYTSGEYRITYIIIQRYLGNAYRAAAESDVCVPIFYLQV